MTKNTLIDKTAVKKKPSPRKKAKVDDDDNDDDDESSEDDDDDSSEDSEDSEDDDDDDSNDDDDDDEDDEDSDSSGDAEDDDKDDDDEEEEEEDEDKTNKVVSSKENNGKESTTSSSSIAASKNDGEDKQASIPTNSATGASSNNNTNKKSHSGGGASRKRQHTQHAVPLESFVSYVNFRIMDSIGYPGTYRKFMLKRREQGAEWAVEMSTNVYIVQQAVKALAQLEQDIKMSHILRNLHLVWQHVVESNTPPSDLQLTIGVCIITAKQNVPCIVIKGKGRGAQNFTVCSKFATFLYHLWIIYKMDVLIKVYTRKCLDEVDPQGTLSLADIANAIKEKEHEVKSMSRSLHAAYTHVSRSAVGRLLAVV